MMSLTGKHGVLPTASAQACPRASGVIYPWHRAPAGPSCRRRICSVPATCATLNPYAKPRRSSHAPGRTCWISGSPGNHRGEYGGYYRQAIAGLRLGLEGVLTGKHQKNPCELGTVTRATMSLPCHEHGAIFLAGTRRRPWVSLSDTGDPRAINNHEPSPAISAHPYGSVPAMGLPNSASARSQSSSGEPSGHPRSCQYE